MIGKLFILFKFFRDMSWKKKLLVFIVLGLVLTPFMPHDNNTVTNSASAEPAIKGANDFIIPDPYSEDNYNFKENNNEKEFTALDSSGNMISIERLNDTEFKELKNSPEFTDRYNGDDGGLSYASHKVSLSDSSISNLYRMVSEDKVLDYYFKDIYYVEVVEVNGDKYKVTIGNPDLNNPSDTNLKEWREYLGKFNKVNKVKTLKVK